MHERTKNIILLRPVSASGSKNRQRQLSNCATGVVEQFVICMQHLSGLTLNARDQQNVVKPKGIVRLTVFCVVAAEHFGPNKSSIEQA